MILSLRSILFACSLALLMITNGDDVRINPAEKAASSHRFDIISWHIKNVPTKWTHLIMNSLSRASMTDVEARTLLMRYFNLTQTVNESTNQILWPYPKPTGRGNPISHELELDRNAVNIESVTRSLRVEEILESAISDVAKDLKLGVLGNFIFPPVDIRLTLPPKVLVTSRRDRIERIHHVLIHPDVRASERELMERDLLRSENLSAVVLDISGVATYPASVHSGAGLKRTLGIAGHEWIHHYLFFKPLGQNMFKSVEMQILTETFADMVGKELGNLAFYTLAMDSSLGNQKSIKHAAGASKTHVECCIGFKFNEEMQETRKEVDKLLAVGKIRVAEKYMEQRRKIFVDNGFQIRKLNQAFFAFNQTYAQNPASDSPIGEQLKRYRNAITDLGVFVKNVANFGSYEEFLDSLSELTE